MSAPADLKETARRLVALRARLGEYADKLIAEAAPALAAATTETETRRLLDKITRRLVAELDREAAAFEVPALVDDDQPKVH